MNSRVSVLILGGRLTANLVGILALQPDAVEFVVSEDTPARYAEICEVLGQFVEIKHLGEPCTLTAYDFAATRDACLTIAHGHPGAEVIFDVTSAPKVMGFAAYEAARSLNQRLVIVDTSNGQVLDLIPPDATPVSIDITLEQYLACYGRRAVFTFDFDKLSIDRQAALQLADYLARAGIPAVEGLNGMRSWSQGSGKRTIPFQKTKPLSPEALVVLGALESFGIISDLQKQADGRVQYTIMNDMDWAYLQGTWLEAYVWNQALSMRHKNGQPLLQDACLGFSFEIPSEGARKEIDVGYVYHGQFIHASCKTEANPFKTRYLDEIRAVSSLVGGRFTSRLFITNAYPRDGDPEYDRFLAQAEDRQIVTVTGPELPNIGAILYKQAVDPDYRRI